MNKQLTLKESNAYIVSAQRITRNINEIDHQALSTAATQLFQAAREIDKLAEIERYKIYGDKK